MLFFERDMTEVEVHPIAGGRAAVFSAADRHRGGPNEDAAALLAPEARCGVLAVADGAGGQPAGARASRVALTALREAIRGRDPPQGDLRASILRGIEAANVLVRELGVSAATTLAVAEIDGERLRPYHVGDSLIALVGQRGKRKLLTVAHSPVGYAVEAGFLDEREAMHHKERHVVSNYVGSPNMKIEVGPTLRIAPRDTVLLATDGLFDNLFVGEIIDAIRAGALGQAAARVANSCRTRMEGEAGRPSKPDDVTFIAYRRRTG